MMSNITRYFPGFYHPTDEIQENSDNQSSAIERNESLLCTIPQELFLHILSYIPFNKRYSFRQSCHYCRHLIGDDYTRIPFTHYFGLDVLSSYRIQLVGAKERALQPTNYDLPIQINPSEAEAGEVLCQEVKDVIEFIKWNNPFTWAISAHNAHEYQRCKIYSAPRDSVSPVNEWPISNISRIYLPISDRQYLEQKACAILSL